MLDFKSSKIEERCEMIEKEFTDFQKKICWQVEQLRQSKVQFLQELQLSRQRISEERELLRREKEEWDREKERIMQI